VVADEASGRLFVADSNHNRIIVSSLSGRVIDTIGSGLPGDGDGIFSQARFNRPQGLALDPSTSLGAGGPILYVADTGNHQIRAVDFQFVRCIRSDVNLKSPWDLALKAGILTSRWRAAPALGDRSGARRAYPYAGTGEEARRDGAVAGAFAQPSVHRSR
jgi:hypothetical protein